MTTEETFDADIMEMMTHVVSAYVSKNAINPNDLPNLMRAVHGQLKTLAETGALPPRPKPAVPIDKSITRQHIICLEDGKKLKMLKRYLRTNYNLTPDEYRIRWGLPASYPMVAPEYAERRSNFAKEIGLGKGNARS